MKIKLIAIAAIALSPAVVLGQTRTHIRVSKDGSHATSTGDVTSSPSSTSTSSSTTTTPSSDDDDRFARRSSTTRRLRPRRPPRRLPRRRLIRRWERPRPRRRRPSSSTTDALVVKQSSSTTTTSTTTTTPTTDSTQLGTGAPAPTPTHSQQTDSSATNHDAADDAEHPPPRPARRRTRLGPTVRMPRSNLSVSPIDSTRMGMPSTRETQRADSARAARAHRDGQHAIRRANSLRASRIAERGEPMRSPRFAFSAAVSQAASIETSPPSAQSRHDSIPDSDSSCSSSDDTSSAA